MALPVETFFLSPDAQGTLQSQIQQMIAQGILSGRFQRGEKLPSTRKLAAHLGVSRITVTIAYTELLANDYLMSKGRSGYYVSENAPSPPTFTASPDTLDAVDWTRAIGQRFSGGITPTKPSDWSSYRYPFIYGQADQSLFDLSRWARRMPCGSPPKCYSPSAVAQHLRTLAITRYAIFWYRRGAM